jgi:hypothetical protein
VQKLIESSVDEDSNIAPLAFKPLLADRHVKCFGFLSIFFRVIQAVDGLMLLKLSTKEQALCKSVVGVSPFCNVLVDRSSIVGFVCVILSHDCVFGRVINVFARVSKGT